MKTPEAGFGREVVNEGSIKTRKVHALIAYCLLLLGLTLASLQTVRAETRQETLNRQLFEALMKQDAKQALILIKKGADPNAQEEPWPPGPVPSSPELATQSPPVKKHRYSPLIRTIIISYDHPNLSLIRAILLRGADVNVTDENENTPLICACDCNQPDIVRLLLKHHAEVNYVNKHMNTCAMSFAIFNRNQKIIKMLKKAGAKKDFIVGGG